MYFSLQKTLDRRVLEKRENDIKKGIILHLLYSEIFKHPLTLSEITDFQSANTASEANEIQTYLNELCANGLILNSHNFYFVFEKESKVERRRSGSDNAQRLLPKARRIARLISKFPFVEGVGISGSLSKGVLHDDGDFDFFIITKPNRLWVSRSILILYKKVFLLNSRKYFCVNYFVDSNNLEIEEKNRFTAVEISTLIPVAGDAISEFHEKNKWVKDYFPNYFRSEIAEAAQKKPIWSKTLTFMFTGRFGEWMDGKMMKITLRRWNKKFGNFNNAKFDLTMKSRKYVSKHHPNDFQNKVLSTHQTLIEKFKITYNDLLEKHGIEL